MIYTSKVLCLNTQTYVRTITSVNTFPIIQILNLSLYHTITNTFAVIQILNFICIYIVLFLIIFRKSTTSLKDNDILFETMNFMGK